MGRAARAALAMLIAALVHTQAASPVLATTEDAPLPGGTTRFDYQRFDASTKTLYMAHMGDGDLIVFDAKAPENVNGHPLLRIMKATAP